MSAMASTGSIAVDDVVPIVATTAQGSQPAARSSATAAASAAGSMASVASVAIRRTPVRPMPRVMAAFSMEL